MSSAYDRHIVCFVFIFHRFVLLYFPMQKSLKYCIHQIIFYCFTDNMSQLLISIHQVY